MSFCRVGGDLVMEVGYFQMPELVAALQEAKADDDASEIGVTVNVVAQYSLSGDTLLRLKTNVDEIYRAMVKSGHVRPEVAEEVNEEPSGE